MDEFELTNGHVVRTGNTYAETIDNQQQGHPEGTRLTVTQIAESPGNINIYFDVDFPADREPLNDYNENEPTIIVADAMRNLLDDGHLVEN